MADRDNEHNQGAAEQTPLEMFRRLWAPLGVPVPGMSMPTLDPAEVEKRIADLKSVENWLGVNLNMVKMAIQGLEVQKIALTAMQANANAASDAAKAFASLSRAGTPGAAPAPASDQTLRSDATESPAAHSSTNPMLWPWGMMQAPSAPDVEVDKRGDKPAASPVDPKRRDRKDRKEGK